LCAWNTEKIVPAMKLEKELTVAGIGFAAAYDMDNYSHPGKNREAFWEVKQLLFELKPES